MIAAWARAMRGGGELHDLNNAALRVKSAGVGTAEEECLHLVTKLWPLQHHAAVLGVRVFERRRCQVGWGKRS